MNKISCIPTSKQIGDYFEAYAKLWLAYRGFVIIQGNFNIPKTGEIDIIACQLKKPTAVLVFIEVRARKKSNYANASQSIITSKQHRLQNTAEYFLQQHPKYAKLPCRFDAIVFNYDKKQNIGAEWLENIF